MKHLTIDFPRPRGTREIGPGSPTCSGDNGSICPASISEISGAGSEDLGRHPPLRAPRDRIALAHTPVAPQRTAKAVRGQAAVMARLGRAVVGLPDRADQPRLRRGVDEPAEDFFRRRPSLALVRQ